MYLFNLRRFHALFVFLLFFSFLVFSFKFFFSSSLTLRTFTDSSIFSLASLFLFFRDFSFSFFLSTVSLLSGSSGFPLSCFFFFFYPAEFEKAVTVKNCLRAVEAKRGGEVEVWSSGLEQREEEMSMSMEEGRE